MSGRFSSPQDVASSSMINFTASIVMPRLQRCRWGPRNTSFPSPPWQMCTFIWRELDGVGLLGSPPTKFCWLCCWQISRRFSESPVNCSRAVRPIVSVDIGEFDIARGGSRSGNLCIIATNPKVHRKGLFCVVLKILPSVD